MQRDQQIYGDWQDMGAVAARSHQRMLLEAGQLAAHWRRCSLSSDFWARYNARFAPAAAPAGYLRRDALEHLLAFLLNELFENCAKFSSSPLGAVRYEAWIEPERMVFQMTNHVTPARGESFEHFIGELLAGDPEELYFQRLEATAEGSAQGSGLGYLTMIKDYGIRFGFRLTPVAPEAVAVDVQAHVAMQEQ